MRNDRKLRKVYKFGNRLFISSYGKIYTKEGNLIRQRDLHGYKYIDLRDDFGKAHLCSVHGLVAEAFLGPKPQILSLNGDELVELKIGVNHKDLIPSHNFYKNLEWSTQQENVKHAVANGAWKTRAGASNPNSKLTKRDVLGIIHKFNSGWLFKDIATYYKISGRMASYIVNGHSWNGVK